MAINYNTNYHRYRIPSISTATNGDGASAARATPSLLMTTISAVVSSSAPQPPSQPSPDAAQDRGYQHERVHL